MRETSVAEAGKIGPMHEGQRKLEKKNDEEEQKIEQKNSEKSLLTKQATYDTIIEEKGV